MTESSIKRDYTHVIEQIIDAAHYEAQSIQVSGRAKRMATVWSIIFTTRMAIDRFSQRSYELV